MFARFVHLDLWKRPEAGMLLSHHIVAFWLPGLETMAGNIHTDLCKTGEHRLPS
jgi:hypothetical protein